ncbi:hypothetical protein D0Z07_7884 [Hyphodiscus hymeniophilus]|uniref:Uncharacterized protein n=1 Tax=Hyphodiscus hymeniophilus TaxID=353542 RepID=A0A9P6SN75_9HELO|nr:hypothetical protein D0Z07_7884 [Hyphodiscus hymeniophilus]
MSPKRKPATSNRVYKSSTPLQQSRFPVRTTSVKYGKQKSKRIPKQETLTQMAFVNLDQPLDEGDEKLGIYEDEAEKPRKRRRITTGDVSSSESKFHTQTLTQIGNWSFSTDPEGQEEDGAVYDIVSSSPQSKEFRRKRAEASKPQKPTIQRSSRRKSAPGIMGPPQTPRKRVRREIPSSESPATPPSRTSPPGNRSALRERSMNIPIPFNTRSKITSPSKLPKLKVEDTFEPDDVSQEPPIPITPSKKSSPAKSVRWADTDEVHQFGDSFPSTDGDLPTNAVLPRSSTPMRGEIMDSEDDEEFEASEDDTSEVDKELPQPETCYGEIGVETQKLLETEDPPASPCIEESQISDRGMPGEMVKDRHPIVDSPVLGDDLAGFLTEETTQHMESQRLETQHVRSMAPRTKVSDVFVSIRPEDVTKIVSRTRNHEFRHQKIPDTVSRMWIYETSPTCTLQYMAVISGARRPGEIEVEDGIGNAEFNTKDPNCGQFAWEILELYELADPLPLATILANEWLNRAPMKPTFVRPAVLDQLMANLKPAIFCRFPSMPELQMELSTDTQEAEEQLLNTIKQYTQLGTGSELAPSQHIKQEDEDPEDLGDDEEYCYEENGEEEKEESDERCHHTLQDPPDHIPNISLSSSSQPNNYSEDAELPLLPQPRIYHTMHAPKEHGTQRSSQAETVDLSQSQTQTPRRHHLTSDIIFESPTRPLFSSTPMTLPPPHERMSSTTESIVPYSMYSSQLLTKSQMLPESLLNDSVPRLTLCIQDSYDEDDL